MNIVDVKELKSIQVSMLGLGPKKRPFLVPKNIVFKKKKKELKNPNRKCFLLRVLEKR